MIISLTFTFHPRDPDRCTRDQCEGYDLCRVAKARWLARVAREVDE